MMDIPHIGFILAAYAVTAAVVGGAVAAVLLDRRALLRSLERLEARAGRGRTGAPR
jgi:heme exporter protein CcmD